MPNTYKSGNVVKVSAVFTDQFGALIDPSVVSIKVVHPNGTIDNFTYVVSGTIIRESVGKYYILRDTTGEIGVCQHTWKSAGLGQAEDNGTFIVIGQ